MCLGNVKESSIARVMFSCLVAAAVVVACACVLAVSAARGECSDLVVMGAAAGAGASPVETIELTALGRTVQERAAASDPRPVVRVYSAQLPEGNRFRTACKPCFDLWAFERTHELPFRLEWHAPEPWVRASPTLHFQDARGQWRKREGFSGPESLRGIFD